ncbi:MAG TPA: MBL fold metallo-hydrolase [Micromonosporaceae bacterium]
MRLVKFEHSCVRVESDAAVLVIDPGTLTSRAALDGVDAVLITHEHADHLNVDMLADELGKRPEVRIFTHTAVAEKIRPLAEIVTTVTAGQRFEAAGFAVRTYGGWHAEIHPDIPSVPNLGYLVDDLLYHPGDSFDVPPEVTVDTLFVPISAPWLKSSESIEFVRAVAPRRAFALHDGLLNDVGLTIVDGLLQRLIGPAYQRLATGAAVPLGRSAKD